MDFSRRRTDNVKKRVSVAACWYCIDVCESIKYTVNINNDVCEAKCAYYNLHQLVLELIIN